jgi:hypothetical protein
MRVDQRGYTQNLKLVLCDTLKDRRSPHLVKQFSVSAICLRHRTPNLIVVITSAETERTKVLSYSYFSTAVELLSHVIKAT